MSGRFDGCCTMHVSWQSRLSVVCVWMWGGGGREVKGKAMRLR